MPKTLLAICLALVSLNAVHAHDGLRGRADKHAPAALMGDHLHDPGEWMIEYRYMNMYMDGNQAGTRRLSDTDAVAFGASSSPVTNRGASPTNMTHEMHMVHIMRGMTEDVTLYAMVMLPSLTMDHIRGPMNPAGPGTFFKTHNSGFGDTTIGALLRLYSDEDDDLIFNLGGSVPTGDIFRTTTIPTGGAVEQPFALPNASGVRNIQRSPRRHLETIF